MNNVIKKIFTNEELGSLRAIIVDEKIWFSLNDICACIEYAKADKALALVDEEDIKIITYKEGREDDELMSLLWTSEADFMKKILVNESGLYAIVFGSRVPRAKQFRRWVLEDVLPSINKNGGYIDGEENLSAEDREVLDVTIRQLSKQVKKLTARNAELEEALNRRSEYWHQRVADVRELRDEKRELKSMNRHLRNECSYLRKDADDNLDMYFREYEAFKAYRDRHSEVPASARHEQPVHTIVVDAQGFVRKIS